MSRAGRTVPFALSMLLLFVACADEPTSPGEVPAPKHSASESSNRAPLQTLDDAFGQLADKVPGGFGGFFASDDGRLTVYLVDVSQREAAIAALAATVRDPGVRAEIARGVTIRQGRFGYRQLMDWRARVGSLPHNGGMTLTDIDETENRLKIGVEREGDRNRIVSEARRLGIPINALSIEVTGPPRLETSLRDYNRPPRGGVQVVPSDGLGGCTLGLNVEHYIYGHTFVTASHCTNVFGGVESTVMYQPLIDDDGGPNRIGVEVVDPQFAPGVWGICPSGYICRLSDAALIKYDENVDFGPGMPPYFDGWWWDTQGVVARTMGTGSITIDASNPNITLDLIEECYWEPCYYNLRTVHKIGRTTGWTSASISNTCANIYLGTRVLLCQWMAPYYSGDSDSGAPVFTLSEDGNDDALFGIHSGAYPNGQRWFSRFRYIREELGYDTSLNCYGFRATYWNDFWRCT